MTPQWSPGRLGFAARRLVVTAVRFEAPLLQSLGCDCALGGRPAVRPRSMRAAGAGWPAGLLLAVVAWLLLVGPQASRAANVTAAAVQEPGMGHEGDGEGEVDEDTDNDTEVPENEPSTEAEAPEEGEGSGSWHVRPPKRAEAHPFLRQGLPVSPSVEFSGIHTSPEFTHLVHL